MEQQQMNKQVYIIGSELGIKKCLDNMTDRNHDICSMITDIGDVPIPADDASMHNLKQHHMDVDDSLDLSGKTHSNKSNDDSPSSPKMKRMKSFDPSCSTSSALSDVGYESDPAEASSEESKTTKANICAIVVDDHKGWNKKLASFAFRTLVWPALILLPIDSEISNIKLYIDFIAEMGIYASMIKDKSKLMVVAITSGDKMVEDHINSIECEILDNYFGKNVEICELDNKFLSKVSDSLSKETDLLNKNRKRPSTSQGAESVKSMNINRMNMSHEFINKFRGILIDIFGTVEAVRYTINISKILKRIKHTSDKRQFLNDLSELGLIYEQGYKGDKSLTLMPFICSETIPVFKKSEYVFDTNSLKMEFKLDTIPLNLRANIFKIFFDQGWFVNSSGPDSCRENSFLFSKGSKGILIHFKSSEQNTSNVIFHGLRTSEKSETFANEEFEKLRVNVENEIDLYMRGATNEYGVLKYYINLHDDQDVESVMKADEEKWLKVDVENIDQEIASNMTKYMTPWFSSEIAKVEKELNQKLCDSILSEIAALFGMGYKLFFVNQGIPYPGLDQIEIDNPKSVKDAVFKMLQEWRKLKGSGANLAVLRSALKDTSHVIVDLYKFDEIVKRHDKQKSKQ